MEFLMNHIKLFLLLILFQTSLKVRKKNLRRITGLITANYAENNLYIYRIEQNQDGNLYSSTQRLA